MAAHSDPFTLGCTRRAAEREADNVHLQLRSGATSLSAIAGTAPLLGALATAVLLKDALRGYLGCLCDLCDCGSGVAETFVPFALGLPVAIFALAGSRYVRRQVEILDVELRVGILDLLDLLATEIMTAPTVPPR